MNDSGERNKIMERVGNNRRGNDCRSKWTKKEGEMKILKVCKQKSKDPGRCIRKNNRFTMEYEYNVNK